MKDVDLIVHNANIVTMDPLLPRAQAIAVANGRVIALGSDREIVGMRGAQTEVFNARQNMLLPGLQDTHIHLQDGGLDLVHSVWLSEVRSVDELVSVLKAHAQRYKGPMILGAGWFPGVFTEDVLTRHVLDSAITDRPVFIYDQSYHSACINTKACQMIGAVRGIADPENGHFVLDADGVPTGMLVEDACYFARARLPGFVESDYYDGLMAGQALANKYGITGILDAKVEDLHCNVYKRAEDAGTLTVRVASTAMVYPNETTETTLERLLRYRKNYHSDMFKVHSAKFFLDGILDNRTAVMLEPYSDEIGGNAELMFGHDQIKELFTAVDAARFQIHVHVIGDGAVRAALDGLEAAQLANGSWPSLHQLAHVQVVHPDDFPRFAKLGVMANCQTLWAYDDPTVPEYTMAMVGPERAPYVYAFRSLIDAGAPYCLSSDWAVTTLNPFEIMETAMTRQMPLKKNPAPPFFPNERLTREQVIKGYTVHAAAAAWRSHDTGSLEVGKFADMIMIDRDLVNCNVYEVSETKVLSTWLGGRQVYTA